MKKQNEVWNWVFILLICLFPVTVLLWGIFVILGLHSLYEFITLYNLHISADVLQLFLDVLLLPTVIIGFWRATVEFRKAQALPNLELFWSGGMTVTREGNFLVLETSEHLEKNFPLMLHVKNKGTSIATWYRINFDVPRELARPEDPELCKVEWRKQERGEKDINPTMSRYTFKSNGEPALYPGEVVHIATLEIKLFPQLQYPKQTQIRYSVVTDRTKIQHGVCKIKIRSQN
jgi:hypothetical protein